MFDQRWMGVVFVFIWASIWIWSGGPALAADGTTMRLTTFGTSLTARGGWQLPLQAALSRCLGRRVEVATVARSGTTSDWALGSIDAVVRTVPDIVLMEFYANDAALNRFVSLARSRSNMVRVVGELRRRLPDARIILMAMSPIHGRRGLVRPFLDRYIEAHRTIAFAAGAEFIDHRPAWAKLGKAEIEAAIPDGAHPKPEVAVAVMLPGLLGQIAGPGCVP